MTNGFSILTITCLVGIYSFSSVEGWNVRRSHQQQQVGHVRSQASQDPFESQSQSNSQQQFGRDEFSNYNNQQENEEDLGGQQIEFSGQSQQQSGGGGGGKGWDYQGKGQLEKDLEKYEQELGKEAEAAGHKGQVSVKDSQVVGQKNENKPWYKRLGGWAGKQWNHFKSNFDSKDFYDNESNDFEFDNSKRR